MRTILIAQRDADFAEAQAARSGMWAASLAAQGFQGAATAVEGEGGFYNAFTGRVKDFASQMDDFALEFLNISERNFT